MSDSTPNPWEFAVGSAESRAAARAMLEARDEGVPRLQIAHSVPSPRQDNSRPRLGQWTPMIDGGFMRVVYIPQNTDVETRERILAASLQAPITA
jgi:hypothetical protein